MRGDQQLLSTEYGDGMIAWPVTLSQITHEAAPGRRVAPIHVQRALKLACFGFSTTIHDERPLARFGMTVDWLGLLCQYLRRGICRSR